MIKIQDALPDLVVVDAHEKRYSRFHGRVNTNVIVTEELLLPEEIETFRVNPQAILPDPEPVPA